MNPKEVTQDGVSDCHMHLHSVHIFEHVSANNMN
jgi:hypothetical protein